MDPIERIERATAVAGEKVKSVTPGAPDPCLGHHQGDQPRCHPACRPGERMLGAGHADGRNAPNARRVWPGGERAGECRTSGQAHRLHGSQPIGSAHLLGPLAPILRGRRTLEVREVGPQARKHSSGAQVDSARSRWPLGGAPWGPVVVSPRLGVRPDGFQLGVGWYFNQHPTAEEVGFEPTVALRPQRFSRPSDSSTLALLQDCSFVFRGPTSSRDRVPGGCQRWSGSESHEPPMVHLPLSRSGRQWWPSASDRGA